MYLKYAPPTEHPLTTALAIQVRVRWGRVAGMALLGIATGVATYSVLTLATEPPTPAPITRTLIETTVDPAASANASRAAHCAEATFQLATYAQDVTAAFDQVVYLYDQGIEYDSSINADNVIPAKKRLSYIQSEYVELCVSK